MKQNTLYLLKTILIVCFFIALLNYSFTPFSPNQQYQWIMLTLAIIGTLNYIYIRKIKFADFQWISIGIIFILGYFIVFYQLIFFDLLGYSVPERFYVFLWADPSVINKSISISTLGLLAFYLGAIFINNKSKATTHIQSKIQISTQNIYFTLFLAYIFYIGFFITAGSYSHGEYAAKDALGISNYLYKLFNITLSAAIIIKVSFMTSLNFKELSFRKYLSYFGAPLLILLFWHILFSLFIGDRGPVIYFSLLTFGLYFIRWKTINFLYIFATILVFSYLFNATGEIRSNRYSGESYLDRLSNVISSSNKDQNTKWFDENIPAAQTIELALSVRTLNHAILNVPEKYNYQYGLFQMQTIYSIVPGLSGVINLLLFENDIRYDGSANFISYLIQGERPKYGDGTSVVADFYLDFGVFGVVMGLFLFGLFVGKNEYKLYQDYQKPTLLWIAILVFFAQAIYLSRSTIMIEISNIIMIYIFIKINTIFISKYSKTIIRS